MTTPPEFSATPIVTFVGEDNPYGADPEFALYPRPDGCSGHRLCDKILGLSERVYLMPHIFRINLCGDEWSLADARAAAAQLLDDPPSGVIVLLGAKVRDAMIHVLKWRALPCRLETWRESMLHLAHNRDPDGTRVANHYVLPLPHPSGRNLVWNEPHRVKLARTLLHELAPEIPWGAP